MSARARVPVLVLAAVEGAACRPSPGSGTEDPSAGTEAPGDPEAGLVAAPRMPDSGRRLRPEEGGFELSLPEDAEPPARSVEGDNHLAWESESAVARFSVEVIHAPGGIANPEEFIERMRERVSQTGTVLDEREGGPDGNPGWSMRLTSVAPREREQIRVELAVTPRRTFLLMATADDAAKLEAPDVVRFFDSFRAVRTTGLSRTIRSDEGRFQAVFPPACGPAFKRVETVDHKVHLSWVSEAEGAAQCMVAMARVDPLPTDEVLGAAVAGATRALPGAVVDATEDSMLRGGPRRSVRVHATVDGVELHMRADFVYVERALYQLQYVTANPDELDTAEVAAFFDSLVVGE